LGGVPRRQRGCVGGRARQQSRNETPVKTEHGGHHGSTHSTEQHDRHGQQVELKPLAAQGGEEAGAELQPDREHKEHQPELLGEFEHTAIDRLTEVTSDDSGEQHPRCPKADAAKFQAAERHPRHGDEREHRDRVRHRM
jgi:hypothetical protein